MSVQYQSIITKLLSRIVCFKQLHIRKYATCKKHNQLHNCQLCSFKSVWITNVYQCKLCTRTFCFVHFIEHLQFNTQFKQHSAVYSCLTTNIEINNTEISFLKGANIIKLARNLQSRLISVTIFSNIKHDTPTVVDLIAQFISINSTTELSALLIRAD